VILPPPRAFNSGGLAVSRPQATRLAFSGLVVVTDLTVVSVRAGGLPAASSLASQGPTLSALAMGRVLPVAAAGNSAYGSFVLRVDGIDGAAGPAAV
jgi:hypothetical protein